MLEAADLQCERGGRMLFRGLSFALKDGELLRVAGANGRGKTSLLRILCGLAVPAAGEVRWQGRPIASLREEYSRQLVYVGHASALKDELTAAENLRFTCALAGVAADRERVRLALDQFGVRDAVVKKLSQGQRRRALLARLVLSVSAPLWLLDEPFAALDASGAATLESLVRAHNARGGIAVYTSHQPARLEGRELSLDG